MTFHIGILGGGNISQTHAWAASEIADAKVVAVCGQNAEKTARLASSMSASAYSDLDAFLDHKPMDVVLIGSPPGVHADQGIQAAGRGLHVLVEKPIAITTEQADALIAACENAGVKLGVFFQDRVAADIAKLKAFIAAGRLGNPFLASGYVKWHRPPEYYKDSRWRGVWGLEGGGALMSQAIHTVDLLLWLMGDVASVWARALTALHNVEVEDTLVAALQFASGAIGTLEAATSVDPGYPRRLEISGPEGTLIIENDALTAANLRSPVAELTVQPAARDHERSVSAVISDVSGHRRVIEDFLDAIATDRRPLCDGREGRRSIELVRAMYESSRTGQSVRLATNG